MDLLYIANIQVLSLCLWGYSNDIVWLILSIAWTILFVIECVKKILTNPNK